MNRRKKQKKKGKTEWSNKTLPKEKAEWTDKHEHKHKEREDRLKTNWN